MSCKTILGKYAEKLEREIKKMNKEIELLYKKLDAQDKIIDEQALEISQLKEQKKQAIEILKDTNVNDNSVLLITTIDYALHILGDNDAKN